MAEPSSARLGRVASYTLTPYLSKNLDEEFVEELTPSTILVVQDVKVACLVISNLLRTVGSICLSKTSRSPCNLLQSITASGGRLQRGLDDFLMSLHVDSGTVAQQYEADKSRQDLSPDVIRFLLLHARREIFLASL